MLRDDACAVRKRFTDEIRLLPCASAELGAAVWRERELRDFCRRIVGWDDARREAVDDVMHALLAAVTARAPIALRGRSDLVPVAHALHRRLLGPERPFVVCDPRRRDGDGSVRSAPNRRRGMDAVLAAVGGSVCLRARRLPADFDEMAESLRGSGPTAQVFVCLSDLDRIRVRDLLSPPIEIPSLAGRAGDLDRLIGESLADATRALGIAGMRFSGRASDSVLRGVTSLAELERGVLRLVAIKSAPNLSQAAARLGVALVSLRRWVDRRGREAVVRDVARLEREDDAEEAAEGRQGVDREDTDDLGGTAEVRCTPDAVRIAPIDESRRPPTAAARRPPQETVEIMARRHTATAKASKATTALVVAPGACNTLADAFELLRLDVIGLEALASAASAAIDEYRLPPSADRRQFHRVHALVGDTAEKAVALVELAEGLKKAFMPRGEADRCDP